MVVFSLDNLTFHCQLAVDVDLVLTFPIGLLLVWMYNEFVKSCARRNDWKDVLMLVDNGFQQDRAFAC